MANFTVKTVKGKKYVYSQQSVNGKQAEKYLGRLDNPEVQKLMNQSKITSKITESAKPLDPNMAEFMLWSDDIIRQLWLRWMYKDASQFGQNANPTLEELIIIVSKDLNFEINGWLKRAVTHLFEAWLKGIPESNIKNLDSYCQTYRKQLDQSSKITESTKPLEPKITL